VSTTILTPTFSKRFTLDTFSVIDYFHTIFDVNPRLSTRARRIIYEAFEYQANTLIVPSVVFVEIFDKWFQPSRIQHEEFVAQFRYEVFERMRLAPNIEIRETDREILEMYINLHDTSADLENRDRLILATAAVLNSPLITVDPAIKNYTKIYQVIPEVIE
jgi:PIN domain nuclease of toxin-antitoxin system